MGKATELADKLRARPLTPAEIAARQAEAQLGDEDVQPTLDGRLVKRAGLSGPPIEVLRAPEQTWD